MHFTPCKLYTNTYKECLLLSNRQKAPQKSSDWLNGESDGSHFLFDSLQRRDLPNLTYLLYI